MLALVSLLLAPRLAAAQDFSVPSGSWAYDDTSFQKAQRIQISKQSIDNMLSMGDSDPGNVGGVGWWPSANVWSTVALHDFWSGTTTYESTVTGAITDAYNNNPQPFRYTDYNDDSGWWANAALYSYLVYGDSDNLNQAAATWSTVNDWVLTAADASGNTSPKGTIEGTCNGQTMAGGVFWNAESDNMYTNSITTGLFAVTSSYLYKFTGNASYSDAAELSLTWMVNQVLTSDNLIADGVTATDCTLSSSYYSYNQGMFVEAVALYQNFTGDTQFNSAAEYVLSAATHDTTTFQGTDGIITEGEGDSDSDGDFFRGAYLRGLAAQYNYQGGSSGSAMNVLIHAYIDDQYMALIDLDSNDSSGSSTDSYSPPWHGPYSSSDTAVWSMQPACDALVAAILVNNNG